MLRRLISGRILLVLFVLTYGQVAHADAMESSAAPSGSAEPHGYRETVAEAVREFAARNYEESRALFARAHALYPNARTHRGLGLAEFELRNYGECSKQFEAALQSTVKPLSEDLKTDTEHMLERAYNFIARVRVDAKPGSSTLVLDGLPVEAPAGQMLLLQVGDHTLEVRAAGFLPERWQLNVQGGEEQRLTIVLAKSPMSESEPPRPNKQAHWYKSPWLWASLGVVVAGAAAGTGYALSQEDKMPTAYGGSRDKVLGGP